MDHNIFKTPELSGIFCQMKAIPIAGVKEDPVKMKEAFARVRKALAEGDAVAVFPEGKLTATGDLNPFRPGIERIVNETGAPVVPIALRGLWGSFFSRAKDGKAFRKHRRVFNKVELEAGALVSANAVSAQSREEKVLAMRGEWK
jgi:1-acyl-sn-glycerol-3-phosphate acyltransferase